jgi:hypothetical protein
MLDWSRLDALDPREWDSIEVRTKVRPPRHMDSNFRIPMQVEVRGGGPRVLFFAHAVIGGGTDALAPDERTLMAAAVQRLSSMVRQTASELEVLTGFVTFDHLAMGAFPYCAVVGLNQFAVDWARFIAGYYWGNLLTAGHLAATGNNLLGLDGITVEKASNWWWVQIDEPYPTCDRAKVRTLRDQLAPVLPEGIRSVDDYFASDRQLFAILDFCF